MTGVLFDEAAVRAAVAAAVTQTDALIALGIAPRANNFRRLQESCARYGLDVPKRVPKPSPRKPRRVGKFTDDGRVREAVQGAKSMNAAIKALGAATTAKNYDALIRACGRFGIEPPPLNGKPYDPSSRRSSRSASFRDRVASAGTREIESIASQSSSVSDMVTRLGAPVSQANVAVVRDLLVSHGVSVPTAKGTRYKLADDEFFAANTRRNGRHSKDRLIADRLIPHEQCAICDIGRVWNGQELELHLDHINGDHEDNRLENLRFLCPNCHSQTETYCKPKSVLELVQPQTSTGAARGVTVGDRGSRRERAPVALRA